MTEERPVEPPEPRDALDLLRELEDLIRGQDARLRAAEAESRRLRHVLEEAAARLGGMLAGERASRAALQAVVDELRAAADAVGRADDDA